MTIYIILYPYALQHADGLWQTFARAEKRGGGNIRLVYLDRFFVRSS